MGGRAGLQQQNLNLLKFKFMSLYKTKLTHITAGVVFKPKGVLNFLVTKPQTSILRVQKTKTKSTKQGKWNKNMTNLCSGFTDP